jgi:hypothetical protein
MTLRNCIFSGLLLLAATSCSNENEQTVINENETAPVTVHVDDFSISMEEIPSEGRTTRAAVDPGTYIGSMTLAFYDVKGKEVYKSTQIKDISNNYTTFGTFSCNLPIGNYTMVAVGSYYGNGDEFSLISPTEAAFTSMRPRETFSATQQVQVTSAGATVETTLSRIVPKFAVKSTDVVSAGVSKMKITFSKGSKRFNPTTGLALDDEGFWQTNSVNPNADLGGKLFVVSFPFITADEEKMDVTIEALDADDHVLFTKLVNDVPLKRNRQTTLQGSIFTAETSGASFKIDTDWLPEYSMDF